MHCFGSITHCFVSLIRNCVLVIIFLCREMLPSSCLSSFSYPSIPQQSLRKVFFLYFFDTKSRLHSLDKALSIVAFLLLFLSSPFFFIFPKVNTPTISSEKCSLSIPLMKKSLLHFLATLSLVKILF